MLMNENKFQTFGLIKKAEELSKKVKIVPPLATSAVKKSGSPKKKNKSVIKMSYIVDQEQGPYFTIQSAIDIAKDGSIIKINTGLYKENLVIRGKSLSLESRDLNSEVYILGSKGPTLYITSKKVRIKRTRTSVHKSNDSYSSGDSSSDSDSETNIHSSNRKFIRK